MREFEIFYQNSEFFVHRIIELMFNNGLLNWCYHFTCTKQYMMYCLALVLMMLNLLVAFLVIC